MRAAKQKTGEPTMPKKKSDQKFKSYMLRTCNADMSAHGGFVWPKSGPVECPDWDDGKHCGNGLHGLLMGAGDASLLNWEPGAPWLVVGIDEWVDLGGKVKAPRGTVVYCGDMRGAADFLLAVGADPAKCVGGTATAGDEGAATAGHRGTATAGDGGTATAGYRGTATAGHRGTATAGDGGTATAGDRGTATAGDEGTATAGDGGTATAGHRGTATAGHRGTATAGYRGTATAGHRGTATAGDGGTATAGDGGCIAIQFWDHARDRYCIRIGYMGEGGLTAGTLYRLEGDKFVPAQPEGGAE